MAYNSFNMLVRFIRHYFAKNICLYIHEGWQYVAFFHLFFSFLSFQLPLSGFSSMIKSIGNFSDKMV